MNFKRYLIFVVLAYLAFNYSPVLAESTSDGIPLSSWIARLKIDPSQKQKALKALAQIGPDAKDALPILIKTLARVDFSDANGLDELGKTFESIGPAAQNELRNQLGNTNYRIRGNAMTLLVNHFPPYQSLVSDLQKGLKDSDPRVRTNAAINLVQMGKASDATTKRLIDCLSNENAGDKIAAISALAKSGDHAKPAVALLTKFLNERYYAEASLQALADLGPLAKDAQPKLELFIKKGNQKKWASMAAFALVKMGAPLEKWMPLAVEDLQFRSIRQFVWKPKDQAIINGQWPLTALEKFSLQPAAETYVIKNMKHQLAANRAGAAKIVALSDKNWKNAEQSLRTALQDEDEDVQLWAAYGLAIRNQLPQKKYPLLINALSRWGSTHQIKMHYVHFDWFGKINALLRKRDRTAMPHLMKGLSSDNPSVVAGVAETLADMPRQHAKTAIPALQKLLKHQEPTIQSMAALALVRLGEDPEPLFAVLMRPLGEAPVGCGVTTDLYTKLEADRVDHMAKMRLRFLHERRSQKIKDCVKANQERFRKSLIPYLGGVDAVNVWDGHVRFVSTLFAECLSSDTSSELKKDLLHALKSGPQRHKLALLKFLAALPNQRGEFAEKTLQAMLTKEDSELVGVPIAYALCKLGKANPNIAQVLQQGLSSTDRAIRRMSAHGIGEMNGAGTKFIPQLMRLLQDDAVEVRIFAADAICQLSENPKELLLDELIRSNGRYQKAIARAIVVHIHVDALGDFDRVLSQSQEKDLKVTVAESLGQMGRLPEVRDVLAKHLQHAKNELRFELADSLWRAGAHHSQVLPTFKEVLNQQNKSIQLRSLQNLQKIGRSSQVAFTEIHKLLNSGVDQDLQIAALKVIGRLDASAQPAFEDIWRLTHAHDKKLSHAAILAPQRT